MEFVFGLTICKDALRTIYETINGQPVQNNNKQTSQHGGTERNRTKMGGEIEHGTEHESSLGWIGYAYGYGVGVGALPASWDIPMMWCHVT